MAKNANDIERFLKEIDKLRKKAAGGDSAPPAARVKAKPPPVVKAVPVSKRVSAVPTDEVPVVVPARRGSSVGVPVAAPVVPQGAVVPGASLSAPLIAELGQVATRINRTGAKTPFAKTILAMLTTKQSVPAAFVLKEIFGEPKCRQKP